MTARPGNARASSTNAATVSANTSRLAASRPANRSGKSSSTASAGGASSSQRAGPVTGVPVGRRRAPAGSAAVPGRHPDARAPPTSSEKSLSRKARRASARCCAVTGARSARASARAHSIGRRVDRHHQHPGQLARDEAHAGQVGGDHRGAQRDRLQHRARQPFPVRGQHQHVGLAQQGTHVLCRPQQVHPVGDTVRAGAGPYPLVVLRIVRPDQHRVHRHAHLRGLGHHRRDQPPPLGPRRSADVQADRLARPDAQAGAQVPAGVRDQPGQVQPVGDHLAARVGGVVGPVAEPQRARTDPEDPGGEPGDQPSTQPALRPPPQVSPPARRRRCGSARSAAVSGPPPRARGSPPRRWPRRSARRAGATGAAAARSAPRSRPKAAAGAPRRRAAPLAGQALRAARPASRSAPRCPGRPAGAAVPRCAARHRRRPGCPAPAPPGSAARRSGTPSGATPQRAGPTNRLADRPGAAAGSIDRHSTDRRGVAAGSLTGPAALAEAVASATAR